MRQPKQEFRKPIWKGDGPWVFADSNDEPFLDLSCQKPLNHGSNYVSEPGINRPCRPCECKEGSPQGLREVGREGFYARLMRGFNMLRAAHGFGRR